MNKIIFDNDKFKDMEKNLDNIDVEDFLKDVKFTKESIKEFERMEKELLII